MLTVPMYYMDPLDLPDDPKWKRPLGSSPVEITSPPTRVLLDSKRAASIRTAMLYYTLMVIAVVCFTIVMFS
jgi:hypothetical protein